MTNGRLVKVSASTAAEVCNHFPLSDEAQQLLRENQTPAQFFELLVTEQLYVDAIRFLAHALPKREAVWWACLCSRQVLPPPQPRVAAALEVAEKWVKEPNEENRKAAMPAAEAAEFNTPAGCSAAAVFWSGGSLAPDNLPVVAPAEHLTGHGVSGAVMLAAVKSEPERAEEKYQTFLALGSDVAKGENTWEKEKCVAQTV